MLPFLLQDLLFLSSNQFVSELTGLLIFPVRIRAYAEAKTTARTNRAVFRGYKALVIQLSPRDYGHPKKSRFSAKLNSHHFENRKH